MAFERMGHRPLDFPRVRYAPSKLDFRGPARDLTGDYIACLGGTETCGTFIERPFAALLERDIRHQCVNFGLPNAGVDAFCLDEGAVALAQRARLRVLQVPCAMNLSNPFYHVHPRRNDRFVEARPRLRRLYPEVDFTEFHYTRHMAGRLAELSPDRFALVVSGLQTVWVDRMQQLLDRLGAPTVLLWFARHPPGRGDGSAGVADDPAFVSRAMLDAVRPRSEGVAEVVISPEARAQGTRGMRFAPMQAPAAAELPGLLAHREAADALAPVLLSLLAR